MASRKFFQKFNEEGTLTNVFISLVSRIHKGEDITIQTIDEHLYMDRVLRDEIIMYIENPEKIDLAYLKSEQGGREAIAERHFHVLLSFKNAGTSDAAIRKYLDRLYIDDVWAKDLNDNWKDIIPDGYFEERFG